VEISTGFSPFQLVYGFELVLLIECEIPSLKIVIELLLDTSKLEEHLVHLEHLYYQHRDDAMVNEAHKKHVKVQYDKFLCPRIFSYGDLILVYDQDKDCMGAGKFNVMWNIPYIVRHVLNKGSYKLIDYNGNVLVDPINGRYLKRFYA
jgi:hypothetical protein